MSLPIPRLHLFEINDQAWFPPPLRAHVQAVLTHLWNLRLPLIQPQSPTFLVSQALQRTLGAHLQDYTYVDFCAGAGGPTPAIEAEVNGLLRRRRRQRQMRDDMVGKKEKAKAKANGGGMGWINGRTHQGNGGGSAGQGGGAVMVVEEEEEEDKEEDEEGGGGEGVDFVLTDIHPHLAAWQRASARSNHLRYVAGSVDAADAPRALLDHVEGGGGGGATTRTRSSSNKKVFRLFNLAFHHFDDELARKIMANTLETSEGFAIFELQGRDLGNLLTVLLIAPLLWLGSWYWFWGEWGHLFWTYVVPVVPIVTVYDGLVSCLRTRRDQEVLRLVNEAAKAGGGLNGWKFEAGGETHTWPIGSMQYLMGVKD